MSRQSVIGVAAAALLCGLVATGCDEPREREVPLEQVPRELAEAACQSARACLGDLLDLLEASADCEAEAEADMEDVLLPLWQDAVAEGSVTYDPSAVGPCREAVAEAGCDYFSNPELPACERVFEGSAAVGQPCRTDVECEPGLACDLSDGCPGACAARGGAGAACEQDDGCDFGMTCQSGGCAEPAGEDEPCGGSTDAECRTGLLCLGEDRDAAGSCADPATAMTEGEGDACNPLEATLCQEGLSCVVDTVVPLAFHCVATSSPGGPCRPGTPDPCPRGQACDADLSGGDLDGTCQPLPEAGEACLSTSLAAPCAAGLQCIDGLCVATQRNGAGCTRSDQCRSGNCEDGICAPPACAG